METPIIAIHPALVLEPVGLDDVVDGLLADQGGGGEHQAGLDQAGEGLGLAVSIAVFGVGRGGGVADGEEGRQRGDQVKARVGGHGRQDRHRAAGDPHHRLEGDEHGRCGHRHQRHPPGQHPALRRAQAMCVHARNLRAPGRKL